MGWKESSAWKKSLIIGVILSLILCAYNLLKSSNSSPLGVSIPGTLFYFLFYSLMFFLFLLPFFSGFFRNTSIIKRICIILSVLIFAWISVLISWGSLVVLLFSIPVGFGVGLLIGNIIDKLIEHHKIRFTDESSSKRDIVWKIVLFDFLFVIIFWLVLSTEFVQRFLDSFSSPMELPLLLYLVLCLVIIILFDVIYSRKRKENFNRFNQNL
ncbi:MAG: hypothetical protein AABX17_04315 [Nanoarchaeota archaeon]